MLDICNGIPSPYPDKVTVAPPQYFKFLTRLYKVYLTQLAEIATTEMYISLPVERREPEDTCWPAAREASFVGPFQVLTPG